MLISSVFQTSMTVPPGARMYARRGGGKQALELCPWAVIKGFDQVTCTECSRRYDSYMCAGCGFFHSRRRCVGSGFLAGQRQGNRLPNEFQVFNLHHHFHDLRPVGG